MKWVEVVSLAARDLKKEEILTDYVATLSVFILKLNLKADWSNIPSS